MNAEELMTHDPMTIDVGGHVRDAVQILQTMEIRHLPVVDKRGLLVGMVSDRDLRNAAIPYTVPPATPARSVLDAPITELMSADVVTVNPETDVKEVIDTLLENKIGAVPVVDDSSGDLVGIVSYVDILRKLRDSVD